MHLTPRCNGRAVELESVSLSRCFLLLSSVFVPEVWKQKKSLEISRPKTQHIKTMKESNKNIQSAQIVSRVLMSEIKNLPVLLGTICHICQWYSFSEKMAARALGSLRRI